MPVAAHLSMLCTQFLANWLQPSHPSHDLVKLPPGPRKNAQGRPLKETLSSKFGDAVAAYLQDGILLEIRYKKTEDQIPTAAVSASIAAAGPNPVLSVIPPDIHPSESSLPRVFQTTFYQLRGDKCSNLKSY
jgi:hypothetical protein